MAASVVKKSILFCAAACDRSEWTGECTLCNCEDMVEFVIALAGAEHEHFAETFAFCHHFLLAMDDGTWVARSRGCVTKS